MSMIQEALDKIQKNRFGKIRRPVKNNVFPPEEAIDMMEVLKKKPTFKILKNKPRFVLLAAGVAVAVAVAVAAIIFALIFFRNQAPVGVDGAASAKVSEVKQNVTYKPITASGKETSSSSAAMPKFVLNGIMHIEGKPRAIINGYTVIEGNSVSGAVVKEIREDSVVLNTRDIEITIDMD